MCKSSSYIYRGTFREAGVVLWFRCADDSFILLKMPEQSCEIPDLKTRLFPICLTHCSSHWRAVSHTRVARRYLCCSCVDFSLLGHPNQITQNLK